MHRKHAFTLVELSIVLVILGLLVGGVLAGQSLIRAAELRAVTTERNNYVVAINAFREKYMALPGDMTNATAFWTAADPDPVACRAVFSTGTETCNGDGDGWIGGPFAAFTDTEENEIQRSWQHLSNAGLVAGQFVGRADYHIYDCHISYPHASCPASKISGGLWNLLYLGTPAGWMNLYVTDYKNALILGADVFGQTYAPVITPGDLYGIDTKTDDGKPGAGRVLSLKGTGIATDCTTTTDPTTAEYNVSYNGTACTYVYKLGF